jgi:hypothetical protein
MTWYGWYLSGLLTVPALYTILVAGISAWGGLLLLVEWMKGIHLRLPRGSE